MANPLMQVDDEVREMTDEEYAQYLEETKDIQPLVDEA